MRSPVTVQPVKQQWAMVMARSPTLMLVERALPPLQRLGPTACFYQLLPLLRLLLEGCHCQPLAGLPVRRTDRQLMRVDLISAITRRQVLVTVTKARVVRRS